MIHHYTSIENLALILDSQKIRFNRLDKVDDIEEYKIIDTKAITTFYISCWTEDKIESIPLWKMYTPNMRGVKISMPIDMFKKKKISRNKYSNIEIFQDLYSPFSLEELVNEKYVITNCPSQNKNEEMYDFYNKVIYKDFSSEDKQDNLFQFEDFLGRSHDCPGSYGFHKNIIWEFQKESRFILRVIPFVANMNFFSPQNVPLFSTNNLKFDNSLFNVEYIDVDLDEKAIDNIEITLGPLCTSGDKILVEALVKTFTKNGKVKISNLTGKIRK